MLYLIAMLGAKHTSPRIFTPPQSTLKTLFVPLTTQLLPPPQHCSLSKKFWVHHYKCCSLFAVPHTLTHLPNSQPFALLIKPRYLPAQVCLKGQQKESPRAQGTEAHPKSEKSTSNLTNCKITPFFFQLCPREKEGNWFPLPWAAAFT